MLKRKITISKRKDISVATKPTHDLIMMDEQYQNKETIGALWTRTSADGNKFLSGQLSEERVGTDGKKYDGYVIITKREYANLVNGQKKHDVVIEGKGLDYGEVIDPADIPFD